MTFRRIPGAPALALAILVLGVLALALTSPDPAAYQHCNTRALSCDPLTTP